MENNLAAANDYSVTRKYPMEDQDSIERQFREFSAAYPEYLATSDFDAMREQEFSRLTRTGHIYLDYTGASLYGESLIDLHTALLKYEVLGNPHSQNLTSTRSNELVENARLHVLEYFDADPEQYCVIFTQNASNAIRTVAEAFPFDRRSCLLLSSDNHNSILGIRQYAKRAEAKVDYIALDELTLRLKAFELKEKIKQSYKGPSLFCFPAQSNYSGVKHDLNYINLAKDNGWFTFVDLAAYVPTNQFSFRKINPDFAALSFYKMFGFPTGIGCLIAKRKSLRILKRPYFSGGTVLGVSVGADTVKIGEGEAVFEDGTVNFSLLPAVATGLKFLQKVGVRDLAIRIGALCSWLISQMQSLKHSNGVPVIEIHGPKDSTLRGPTIAFSVRDPNAEWWDSRIIEATASTLKISLRSGYHCNPGANEAAMRISPGELKKIYSHDDIDEFLWAQERSLRGAVRVSLGLATNFSDVYKFFQFLNTYLDRFHG